MKTAADAKDAEEWIWGQWKLAPSLYAMFGVLQYTHAPV